MAHKYLCLSLIVIFLACKKQKTLLEHVLELPDPSIQEVMKNKEEHEIQILLSQIERSPSGKISFSESTFQVDEQQYFYPASTVKLPIAILALQKLKELKARGIKISAATHFTIANQEGAKIFDKDSTHPDGFVTINHLIKKIFLVSDNDAYNYLFDFLGRDYIHMALSNRGLKNSQIYHKFLQGGNNNATWEYTFFDENNDTLYYQPSIQARLQHKPRELRGVLKGQGYMRTGVLIENPMNFKDKNRISVQDLQGILKRVIFPEVFPASQQFDLDDSDYAFLRHWMSRTTLESKIPAYSDSSYWDSYGKFLVYGDTKGSMTDALRIYNKVGYAYGTLTDVAYVVNKDKGLEFFLTATVLVNKNGIFNDDVYEFDSVGIPF